LRQAHDALAFLSNRHVFDNGGMKNPPVVISDSPDEAEAQLQALIAECRQIIREVVVPAAEAAEEGGERRR